MKNQIRLAMLCMAVSSAPALAQSALPACGAANFDAQRNLFTVINPATNMVNQQCLVTVYPAGSMPADARNNPGSYLAEGTYTIEMSSGGGGGGGGGPKDGGGGGGGAGAVPERVSQYLAPGVYKLTLGSGGLGGAAGGGRTQDGNPSSFTNVRTGQLIAGYAGADTWTNVSQPASDGRGGVGTPGGSTGGSGGDSGAGKEERAQSGSASSTGGYSGVAGQAGTESGRSANDGRGPQANAGGGGGAGMGSGGAGQSATGNTPAGTGDLGGGGGGGRGGLTTAEAGGRGGHGSMRVSLTQATQAPMIMAAAPTTTVQRYSLSADALFAFGKSTLTPAGEGKIDELLSKLRSVNVESITDTGHADRIGTSESNHALSLNRAQAVKTYMVSKGIGSNIINVVGKGETQPVTRYDDCKGPTSAKVIACLQPDRRVDLDVVVTSR